MRNWFIAVLAAIVLVSACLGWFMYRGFQGLQREVGSLREELSAAIELVGDSSQPVEQPRRSISDAKRRVEGLNEPEELAKALAEIDLWVLEQSEQGQFDRLMDQEQERLRKLIAERVRSLHQQARDKALEKDSDGAERLYAGAGRILALFPASEDSGVMEEARNLVAEHQKVGARLSQIRRLQYNQWAVDQIERALDDYTKKNVGLKEAITGTDDDALTDSFVAHLGQVDPALLDSAVFELYQHALKRTLDDLDEAHKIELSRRLTDPKNERKTLEEFK